MCSSDLQWYALFAPAKTPESVVARINTELNAVLQQPEILSRIDADGARAQTGTPDELARLLESERKKWRQVVQRTGLRPETQESD